MRLSGLRTAALAAVAVVCASPDAFAQKKYDTGASDTEIKIGNIMPYSGPASAYGVIGKVLAAYFDKVNAEAAETETAPVLPQKPAAPRVAESSSAAPTRRWPTCWPGAGTWRSCVPGPTPATAGRRR